MPVTPKIKGKRLEKLTLSKRNLVKLSLNEKMKLLKDQEKGAAITKLSKDYGVNESGVSCIIKPRDEIVAKFTLKSMKNIGEDMHHQDVYVIKNQADYADNDFSDTDTVGTAKYSQLEIEDLHGNVVKEEYIDLSENEGDCNLSSRMDAPGTGSDDAWRNSSMREEQKTYEQVKGEEWISEQSSFVSKKTATLPFHKKVQLLQDREKGVSVLKLSKIYGLSKPGTRYIINRKDEILKFMKDSQEKGIERCWEKTRLPSKKSINLPLHKMVQLLKDRKTGESIPKLAKAYGLRETGVRGIISREDEIINLLAKSREKGEDYNLDRTQLPRRKPGTLSPGKKVQLLKDIESGKTVTSLTMQYGISLSAIYRAKYKNDKIPCNPKKNFVAQGRISGNSKQKHLPLYKKVQILKDNEMGDGIAKLASIYNLSLAGIRGIISRKDEILNYVNYLRERGEDCNLARTNLPSRKSQNLPLYTITQLLKDREKGESVAKLVNAYDLSEARVRCIISRKDEILNYVNELKDRGEEKNLEQMHLPLKKRTFLSLHKKAELLRDREKGESVSRLAKAYGLSESGVHHIIRKREKILNNLEHSKKTKKRRNLAPGSLASKQFFKLTLRQKTQLLNQRKNGETISRLAKVYDISPFTVRNIIKRKDEIVSYMSDSLSKKECDTSAVIINNTQAEKGQVVDDAKFMMKDHVEKLPRDISLILDKSGAIQEVTFSKLESENWYKNVKKEHMDLSVDEGEESNSCKVALKKEFHDVSKTWKKCSWLNTSVVSPAKVERPDLVCAMVKKEPFDDMSGILDDDSPEFIKI